MNGTLDHLKKSWRLLDRLTYPFRHARRMRGAARTPLNAYERHVYSQNGEDGILEEIFARIGTTNCYVVEFGVEDGRECNAAYLLRRKRWSGLLIEGDEFKFGRLQQTFRRLRGVSTARAFLTAENIVSVFERHGVPLDFDLLSIDVDGNDYWIWSALERYRPRVVTIEYNALYPPPTRWVMEYDCDHEWDGSSHHGASLSALHDLATDLGYRLVATDSHGANAFFVRDGTNESRLPGLTPEEAYHVARYGLLYRHHPYRPGPSVSGR